MKEEIRPFLFLLSWFLQDDDDVRSPNGNSNKRISLQATSFYQTLLHPQSSTFCFLLKLRFFLRDFACTRSTKWRTICVSNRRRLLAWKLIIIIMKMKSSSFIKAQQKLLLIWLSLSTLLCLCLVFFCIALPWVSWVIYTRAIYTSHTRYHTLHQVPQKVLRFRYFHFLIERYCVQHTLMLYNVSEMNVNYHFTSAFAVFSVCRCFKCLGGDEEQKQLNFVCVHWSFDRYCVSLHCIMSELVV